MESNLSVENTISGKKYGIGYCSTSVIYNAVTKERKGNIFVVPVDLNANGQADDYELVFDKLDNLKTAISSGKYPSPPARKLYLVTKSKPKDEALKTFLSWVLGIGQNYFDQTALINIDRKTADKFVNELK